MSELAVFQFTPAQVNDMVSRPNPSGRNTSLPGVSFVTNEDMPDPVAAPKSGSAGDPMGVKATVILTGSAAANGGNARPHIVRKTAAIEDESLLMFAPGRYNGAFRVRGTQRPFPGGDTFCEHRSGA